MTNSRSGAARLGRFSLRLMLLMMTLVAGVFAVWSSLIEPYRRQAAAVERVGELHSSNTQLFGAILGQPGVSGLVVENDASDSLWHKSLVEFAVGEKQFVKVRELKMPPGTKDTDLTFVLARLPYLKSVELSKSDVSVTAASLLGKMPELESLTASQSNISDEAITQLTQSQSIESMRLTSNPITDEAVSSLERMKSMQEIFLRWTKMTPDGAERLQEKLPDCKVWFHARAKES